MKTFVSTYLLPINSAYYKILSQFYIAWATLVIKQLLYTQKSYFHGFNNFSTYI